MKIFDALTLIHRAGYVFNDLKLDNIMINGDLKSPCDLKNAEIHLIDFGFAKKYYRSIKTDGGHRHLHLE